MPMLGHNIPMMTVGGVFVLVGAFMFVAGFGKVPKSDESKPLKKAEQRALTEKRTEAGKYRLGGLICMVLGASMMIIFSGKNFF